MPFALVVTLYLRSQALRRQSGPGIQHVVIEHFVVMFCLPCGRGLSINLNRLL